MSSVQYGSHTIEYSTLIKERLKSHYITVERGQGVVLKGRVLSSDEADQLILSKAKWILDKLELVKSILDDDIVTGSRVQYLGRKYYVEVFVNDELDEVNIEFTESKFKVSLPNHLNKQVEIKQAFEVFFAFRANERIAPRVRKWSKLTGLEYTSLHFKQLDKRWGSCTPTNKIIINLDAVKLPFSLIDYLIVHELVHTQIKNHSKEFWAEVAKHLPNWRELDEKMYGMKL